MQISKNKIRVGAGPLRLTLWILGAITLVVLFRMDPGADDPYSAARDAADSSTTGDPAAAGDEFTTEDPAAPPRVGPPAVRFGSLDRAAHLPVLSGLKMNLYALAARQDGWVEHRIFERASALANAIATGEIDIAAAPLRDAARLAATDDPANEIVIVAGVALGDERIVLRPEVKGDTVANLRVGVLDPPVLDVAKQLGLDRESDAPTVALKTSSQVGPALLTRELEAVVAPEPFATSFAERVGGRTIALDGEQTPRTGAVLIMRRAFVTKHPRLAAELVQAHELSTFLTKQDLPTAIARTRQLLLDASLTPPVDEVFATALATTTFGTDVPRADLAALLALAGAPEADVKAVLDRTIDTEMLKVAREIAKEARESAGG
jgi:ABC-type nitrate/sulfonate/bicarbonate transport system substrate-binding protein